MTEPARTIDAPCGCCGHSRPIINPAWLVWKRTQAGAIQGAIALQAGVSISFVGTVEAGRRPCPSHLLTIYEGLHNG